MDLRIAMRYGDPTSSSSRGLSTLDNRAYVNHQRTGMKIESVVAYASDAQIAWRLRKSGRLTDDRDTQ